MQRLIDRKFKGFALQKMDKNFKNGHKSLASND